MFVIAAFSSKAQWTNRYPKLDTYSHHVYIEGYELPVLASGPAYPSVSPLGNKIAFSAKGYIWLLDEDSGIASRITSSGDLDYKPQWSNDGKKLVFIRDNYSDTYIVLLDLETKMETILVDEKAMDLDPVFSKDDKYVYYSSGLSGNMDIWRVNVETKEKTCISDKKGLKRKPILSEQDDLLYIKKFRNDDYIELMDTTSKINILLKSKITAQIDIALSPDNETLVYTYPDNDKFELKLMNINKTDGIIQLTRSNGITMSPCFSSDGKWVYYYEANNSETTELKKISVFGGKIETIGISNWNWGKNKGKVRITTYVDGKKEAVRLSVKDERGHPVIPENGMIHFEGQNGNVFFYSDGEVVLEAESGVVNICAAKGFSVPLEHQKIRIEKDSLVEIILDLKRIWNAREEGWYCGDNHFHLNYGGIYNLDPGDIVVDLNAEEIDFAFPMVANISNRLINQELFGWRKDNLPVISFAQEVRSNFFGHIGIIGIDELYWPWAYGPTY